MEGTTFHIVRSNEPSRSRGRAVVAGAFVCGLVFAVALVTSGGNAKRTSLAMMDDIATINDIHAAYIHGSVPTAKGESDDIMNMNFPDERNGADSKANMPSAYVRGSVDTFKAEAADITSKGAAHGVVAHKDAVKEQLAMMDDIATINDIHAAYIHGSVPTAKGESDDIMNMNFPDERNGADSKANMPSAYVRGSVDTFKAEAADITSKGATHGVVAHKDAVREKLMQLHKFVKSTSLKGLKTSKVTVALKARPHSKAAGPAGKTASLKQMNTFNKH